MNPMFKMSQGTGGAMGHPSNAHHPNSNAFHPSSNPQNNTLQVGSGLAQGIGGSAIGSGVPPRSQQSNSMFSGSNQSNNNAAHQNFISSGG